MKKLIVSMKSTQDMFLEFKQTTIKARKNKASKTTHYEISFENKKDFNKFGDFSDPPGGPSPMCPPECFLTFRLRLVVLFGRNSLSANLACLCC